MEQDEEESKTIMLRGLSLHVTEDDVSFQPDFVKLSVYVYAICEDEKINILIKKREDNLASGLLKLFL